ncbi:MAG: excisionase family DNA-binding protein [Ardenticatenaceae bacterium]|nr:excisionase family DNA-binding protein [Ardenticatenaceae bacterium]HBY93711.1 DNA-binding protein [Chloroflexota bacterium]
MTQEEWLSLSEASALLGVHPSTLRRWSDQGEIESTRTSGGHRRFTRGAVEQYLRGQQLPERAEPAPKGQITPSTTTDMSQAWRDSFPAEHREAVRHLGQRLLGLMLQYLTRQNEDERFLQESRAIGRRYGAEIAKAGLAMLQVVEAFLYFRSQFTDMALALPAFPRPGDEAESRRLHGRVDRFMNEVLLGTIEGWELGTGGRVLTLG